MLVFAAAVAALGACSSGSHSVSRGAPTASSRQSTGIVTTVPQPATTTPAPAPAFSFDDSVPPPKLVNTGTDYVAILKSLEGYGVWLTAHHPDPSLTPTFVASGTNLYDSAGAALTSLRNRGQRLVETTSAPDRFTIISSTANAFSARIVQQITSHRIVDRLRHVVREARFTGSTTYLAVAVRVHERWYLASSDVTIAPERVT